jgi:hypothetical protein
MNGKEFLTISEMADRLKVKKSWLYRQTMNTGEGAIPRLKLKKYLRFDPDKVFQWIENQNAVQAA